MPPVTRAAGGYGPATKINPEATFGREKFQLMFMVGFIAPPAVTDPTQLPDFLGIDWTQSPDEPAVRDAVRGLTGLIALDDAWESVDVFNALRRALSSYRDRKTLPYPAHLRAIELAAKAKGSML